MTRFNERWCGKSVHIKLAGGSKVRGRVLEPDDEAWLKVRVGGFDNYKVRDIEINPFHIVQINETESIEHEEDV